uniref:Profilin-2-like n=1 Tax=Salmo trutta TaxID=8032 RepID=A0A673WFF5_SALTR
MAWDGYITNLMAGTPPFVQEAAICGSEAGKESVWAATPGGQLAGVTVSRLANVCVLCFSVVDQPGSSQLTGRALIIVKGMKDIPGGKINIKASDMMQYLRKSGF